MLNQWNDRIVFAWILLVLKQIYVYPMQFALEWAKTNPCKIPPFQFLFVTIDNKDSISIASVLNCYFLLFYYMLSLLSFIFAVSGYSSLTIRHFIVSKWIEHTKKLHYTINQKYALFYLSIHNDGKHQLCTSNTCKSNSFGNQYPHQLWYFKQHSIWTKMEQSIVDVSIS